VSGATSAKSFVVEHDVSPGRSRRITLRRREAASLRWSDVDFVQRVIRLPAASTKAKRKLDLPMTDVVRDIFLERQRLGRETFVFGANSRSGHLEEPNFFLDQVATRSGISISAHDLRRTLVTVAESADISPLALKALGQPRARRRCDERLHPIDRREIARAGPARGRSSQAAVQY
jgi:integrase